MRSRYPFTDWVERATIAGGGLSTAHANPKLRLQGILLRGDGTFISTQAAVGATLNTNLGGEFIWTPGGGLLDWRLGYRFSGTIFEADDFQELTNLGHTIQTRGRWRFFPRTSSDPGAVTLALSSIAVGYNRDFFYSYIGSYFGRDRGYLNLFYFFSGRVLVLLEGGVAAISTSTTFPPKSAATSHPRPLPSTPSRGSRSQAARSSANPSRREYRTVTQCRPPNRSS